MKLVKKTLEQIPLEPCHMCDNAPKEALLIMTAKLVNYRNEKLLVTTFYHRDSGKPFCRIFCNRDRYINKFYEGGGWTDATVQNIHIPSARYYESPTGRGVTFIADNKSAAAGKRYFHNGDMNTLDAIVAFQNNQLLAKRIERYRADAQLTEEIMGKFPDIPVDVEQKLLDGPLKYSRYLFYQRQNVYDPLSGCREKVYFGYCTHCRTESRLDFYPKHNEEGQRCPHCGSVVTTKARGISHSRLIDECYYLVFSRDSSGTVYARYLRAERNYRGEPEEVRTRFYEKERFCFTKGNAYKFLPRTEGWRDPQITGWEKKQYVTEPSISLAFGSKRDYWIHPFPAHFFDDTDLRHSHIEDYLKAVAKEEQTGNRLHICEWRQAPMEYLAAYCRYPNIEHLLDSGLFYLLQARLHKHAYAREAINLKYSRPRDMLGLSQPELLMVAERHMECREIVLYRQFKEKLARPMDAEDIAIIQDCQYSGEKFTNMEHRCTVQRLFSYLKRQKRRLSKQYRTYSLVLGDWNDYLDQCKELKYNLKQENILYPPDLHKAHQKTNELLKQKRAEEARLKSEAERQQYLERLNKLERYTYVSEDAGLLIRAAQSRQELVDEGAALSHCVGGYADSHLKGKTTIFFIRSTEKPNQSYFTLEFKNGMIMQNRGLKNCDPPDNVKRFAQKWLKEIALPLWNKEQKAAKRKQTENRVRVAVA